MTSELRGPFEVEVDEGVEKLWAEVSHEGPGAHVGVLMAVRPDFIGEMAGKGIRGYPRTYAEACHEE